MAQYDTWKKMAERADRMEAAVSSDHFQTIDNEIFKQIEQEAMDALVSPTLDLTDLNQLYQFRAGCLAIKLIRQRIRRIIQEGIDARFHLNDLKQRSNPQEESNG